MVEALNFYHQVYGPLHSDIAVCYRYAARHFTRQKKTSTFVKVDALISKLELDSGAAMRK
jgi:hypothetical protein